MRPTPPLARSVKYCTILALGRPVSLAMEIFPIGPMTSLFLIVMLFTLIGEKMLV
ncbi:MAG: hypothetical protein SVR04_16425 [Spirochaetota bacterium]|nr:hypothetical protein [Spirochaetota bacterium]